MPATLSKEDVRYLMKQYERDLGVSCGYGHAEDREAYAQYEARKASHDVDSLDKGRAKRSGLMMGHENSSRET